MVGYSYNLLDLKQFLSWEQPNNRIKFFQQALPHLGLWFRVYIGTVYLSIGSGSRLIIKIYFEAEENKENVENRKFCLDWSVTTLLLLKFCQIYCDQQRQIYFFYQLSQQQRPNFKRGLLLPHRQLQLPPRQQLQLPRLDLFLVFQLQQHTKVLSHQQNQLNHPWFRQRVVREDM